MSLKIWFIFSLIVHGHLYNMPTIILAPDGDKIKTGRTIGNSFERTITFDIATALKNHMESYYNCTVLITRRPAEIVDPLQNATFSNRLNADLYVSIHACQETDDHQKLYVYYFSQGLSLLPSYPPLSYIPYDRAYITNHAITQRYAHTLVTLLGSQLSIEGPYPCQLAPLMGISAPALLLEWTLKQSNEWDSSIQTIAHALIKMVTE